MTLDSPSKWLSNEADQTTKESYNGGHKSYHPPKEVFFTILNNIPLSKDFTYLIKTQKIKTCNISYVSVPL